MQMKLRRFIYKLVWRGVYLQWTHENPTEWILALSGPTHMMGKSSLVRLTEYLDRRRTDYPFIFSPCFVIGCLQPDYEPGDNKNEVCADCTLKYISFLAFNPKTQQYRSGFELFFLYLRLIFFGKIIIEIPKTKTMRIL